MNPWGELAQAEKDNVPAQLQQRQLRFWWRWILSLLRFNPAVY